MPYSKLKIQLTFMNYISSAFSFSPRELWLTPRQFVKKNA